MTHRWQHYRQAQAALPTHNLAWPFFGAGLDNVGVEGRPVIEPLPACAPDEILVRVDALGLCASDAKMVRLGLDYPLFFARDLAANPAQLGHEAALTVVQVGAQWRDCYAVGQRLGIQPDVYSAGQRVIFGVNLPGAMSQYVTLDPRVLAGDGGSYVFPAPAEMGYAEVALLEPWACVDVAYSPAARRLAPKPGGLLWIAGQPGDTARYTMRRVLDSRLVVLSDAPDAFAAWMYSQPVPVIERDGASAAAVAQEFGSGAGIDDIILLDPPHAATVAGAVAALADHGTLNLVRAQPLDARVAVDMHKLHYQHLALLGCPGPDIAAAYGAAANRSELRAGGVTWIMGAGGAMGRMHLQRALQMRERPRAILATNRGTARLDALRHDYAAQAAAAGVELITVSPVAEPARLAREMERLTGGRGCDDIVVVVPDPAAVDAAAPHLAHDGLLVVFAGVPAGAPIHLPLDWTARYGAQFTGASGSTVADQRRVIEKMQQDALATAQIVAAVGGMNALQAGLHAVMAHHYPGKVVIYPHLVDLPLLSLPQLKDALPAVYARLGPGETWSNAAEQALFEAYWERA
ncbi:MAG: alcohol dehydrogenase catalytic domain-containing protein [Caldilineaceae bacterium]|jgi:threonine dehydrogenase-like Zn-dependent dehydrogenase|nr:alcohol dehydrogenase catalytic domain-containing protein [Caldilineaceae bacterium]